MVTRMNISLPDELKRRMDEIEDINWSEEARGAFERALIINKRMEGSEMEDVVARLRASKKEIAKVREAEGFEHGQDWAKIVADFEQLEALSKIEDVDGLEDPVEAFVEAWSPEEWDQGIPYAYEIFRETEEDLAKTMERSQPYTRGFIKGAQSIFNQVKNKL